MNGGFAIAAVLSALTCGVHIFAGGPEVARPLLDTTALTPASKWLSYYCWHIVSILIAAMSGSFAAAAVGSMAEDSATLMTILAASLALLSASVAVKGGISPLQFPSTWLFTLIALAGGFGFAF